LVNQCVYAVRFNEDEATVREVDYMDAMYCMGVIDGILGANRLAREQGMGHASFCLPGPMKPWFAAKVVVDYAKVPPRVAVAQGSAIRDARHGRRLPMQVMGKQRRVTHAPAPIHVACKAQADPTENPGRGAAEYADAVALGRGRDAMRRPVERPPWSLFPATSAFRSPAC
jgi:hypothetical protein